MLRVDVLIIDDFALRPMKTIDTARSPPILGTGRPPRSRVEPLTHRVFAMNGQVYDLVVCAFTQGGPVA